MTLRFIQKVFSVLCWVGVLTHPGLETAHNTINTASITTDTLLALPHCLHYKVVGLCYWLECTGSCHVTTTPKVDHFLPDVVITTYSQYGKDPWLDINKSIDIADHVAGNAAFGVLNPGFSIKPGAFNSINNHNNDIQLKEVNVIGNPALASLHWKHLLKGQAKPYIPYYQSQLDANQWRSGLLELLYPKTWIPGKNTVGKALVNEWGSLYPREGFILQPNSAKASAVIAVRGGNIATTPSYGHLSKNLAGTSCPEQGCITAGPIVSHTPKVQWQRLLPDAQTSCHVRIDDDTHNHWVKHPLAHQAYAWIVWREYRGCISSSGEYIGSVGAA